MRKTLKRFLTTALCSAMLVAAGLGVNALTTDVAKAEETTPLVISGRTLNVSNNVNIVFLIKRSAGDASNIEVVATEVNAVDGKKEQPVILKSNSTYTDSEGTVYYEYIYKGVSATEMPNVVYAYARLVDDYSVVSPTRKFSIIEYAHLSLDKGNDKLDALIRAALDYGEAAAAFEGKNLPADYENDYKFMQLTNATFEDESTYSYVYEGQEIVVVPNEGYTLADGVGGFTWNAEEKNYTYSVPEGKLNLDNAFIDNSANVPDGDKIAHVAECLTLNFNTAVVGDVVEGLPVIPDVYEDVSIVWSAENAEVHGTTVTFTANGQVTLVATISCGDETTTKSFTITVDKNDTQKVEDAKAALETLCTATTAKKTEKMTLPTTISGHSVGISWIVSGAALSSNEVTFNTVGTATLTATITLGGASTKFVWTITVSEPVVVTCAEFTLGADGSATHKDGSAAKSSYSETVNGYTLNITGADKMYPGSIDAKGNGSIKFGTGSVAGKCTFTVPENVKQVVIYVAKYKDNTSKVNINGTTHTLTKNSNDGQYDEIVVDTTSEKTITITTVSGGWRMMMNTIVFKGYA